MNRMYLVALPVTVLLVASTIGCGGAKAKAEKKLIGTWELDTEQLKTAMEAEMKKEAGDEPGAEMGAALLSGMLSSMKMSMEFKDGGKLTFSVNAMGQSETKEGTWKVISASGDKVTLEIAMGDEEAEEGTVTFIDDDTMEIVPPKDEDMPPGLSTLKMKSTSAK